MPEYKPYPWPWAYPSILPPEPSIEEQHAASFRLPAKSWLHEDWEEDEDSSSDYSPSQNSEYSGTSDVSSNSDSDEEMTDVSEYKAELDAILRANRVHLTPGNSSWEERREDLPRKIALLVEEERKATVAYDADEIAALVTKFYELLVEMGHWEASDVLYPPHIDPPLDLQLARELGHSDSVLEIMQKLPYVRKMVARQERKLILARSYLADYTDESDLRESRRTHIYAADNSPLLDPWVLPLIFSGRDGSSVMLDTKLGVVRVVVNDGFYMDDDIVEYLRHGHLDQSNIEKAHEEKYRRVPTVPAAHYFKELIFAYHSLSRLPIIEPDKSDPHFMPQQYHQSLTWYYESERRQKTALLALYGQHGWPDRWHRDAFLEQWTEEKRAIDTWARGEMEGSGN
ncbi:hypothetical protein MIND_00428400 [Mycena indigotica]|uniref:Uncharacterized protein n=1 Tax=Mycena indigotica TaxID=2126181 RepID=A0A8H6SXY4_9AGAR|nr:uncharacterized protein MIND_00428400 [Mycena indigotica]KAF7306372.1 hypothetical protein MIND_00428400 [Mycena indigotica]